MTKEILRLQDIHFSYHRNEVLKGVNLSIPKGSIYGYLGKNGSGKSTTIKMLLGLLPLHQGDIVFDGESLKTSPQHLRAASGSMIEHATFYPFMTVGEHLQYLNLMHPMEKGREAEVLDMTGLQAHRDKKAKALSSGLKQRLGLAMSLYHRPRMLILDEPLNALDPQGIYELRHLLQQLNREEGVTIFLSSHILEELEKVADHLAIINDGRIVYQGTMASLQAQESNVVRIKVDRWEVLTPDHPICQRWAVTLGGDHLLQVKMTSEEDFAELIAALVNAGLKVYDVQRQQSMLEDFFIHLTEEHHP